MLLQVYEWTLSLAGSRNADWALAVAGFIESSVFPIPRDVLLIPLVLAQRHRDAEQQPEPLLDKVAQRVADAPRQRLVGGFLVVGLVR